MAIAQLRALEGDVRRPDRASSVEQRRREVDPDDAASGGPEKLTGKLTDEPKPDDRHRLAETDIRLAYAVHRDAADGGEGAALEIDLVGERHAQVRRNVVNLRVDRIVGPAACHTISRDEVAHARADGQHYPSRGVAQCRRLLQAGAHSANGLAHPVALGLLHHLPNLVGACPSLADQALLPRLDLAALRPGAEQACADVNEHTVRQNGGVRDIDDGDASVTQALGDLLHATTTASTDAISDVCPTGKSQIPLIRDKEG